MSRQLLVMSPKRVQLLSADELIRAAEERFGSILRVQTVAEGPADCELYITPADDYPFSLAHFAHNRTIALEGTPEQNAELAAWVRSLLPADFPRVIAADQGWLGHVDLTPGITAEEVLSRWVDHSTPAWDANDPDLR